MAIIIPQKFKAILEKDTTLDSLVRSTASKYGHIFEENTLFFFEEYTDHGIKHINNVLQCAEDIITTETIENLMTPKNVAMLVFAIFLHDLGMHISFAGFNQLLEGKYDDIRITDLDGKSWHNLWEEYLDEAKKFSGKQNKKVFGDDDYNFERPDLSKKDSLKGSDKKLIGEFIRRHHPRIAHEVAIKGLVDKNGTFLQFMDDSIDESYPKIAGIIARSHGLPIRSTFKYLETISKEEWSRPFQIDIVFLMVVLRVADYFQIDSERVNKTTLKFKTFVSPVSDFEHHKHLAIKFIQPNSKDKETLYIEANPSNSRTWKGLIDLFKDIQSELDMSWAVLGEIYGTYNLNIQPKIKYRRVKSNLDDRDEFQTTVNYIADNVSFESDTELPKLLIAPLYGDNPTFGVRELLQNSLDACRDRESENNQSYVPKIEINITTEDNEYYFEILDNGKGMSYSEIKNYFLKAGASYRKSLHWQRKHTDNNGNSTIQRSGRFGVGILAAFLIGNKIEVETRHINESIGYKFTARLDDEQIEIIKTEELQIGTKIRILLSKNAFSLFQSNSEGEIDLRGEFFDDEFETRGISWEQWYTLKTPMISYKSSISPIMPYSKFDINNIDQLPDDWHEVPDTEFEKVIWTYSNDYTGAKITCNGIVIPTSYEIDSSLISIAPKISIFDFNGKLALNLSRNGLEAGAINFEENLKESVFKDIIAKLLCFTPRSRVFPTKVKLYDEIFEHPAMGENYMFVYEEFEGDLYFNNEGFLLEYDFFLNNIPTSILMEVCTQESVLISNVNSKNVFWNLVPDLTPSIDRSAKYIDPDNFYLEQGRVYIKENLYDYFFDRKKNRIRKGLKDNHSKKSTHNAWVEYTYGNYPFNRIYTWEEMDELCDGANFIIEKRMPVWHSDFNETRFDNLLNRYFGSNVVIPYDIQKRKQLYELAFSELEPYMRKYLKNDK